MQLLRDTHYPQLSLGVFIDVCVIEQNKKLEADGYL